MYFLSEKNSYSNKIIKNCGDLIAGFADFFFPRYCIVCQEKLTDKENVCCLKCFKKMKRIEEPKCKICGGTIRGKIKNNLCPSCPDPPVYFKFAASVFFYNLVPGTIIKSIKYKGRDDAASLAGKIMAAYFNENLSNNKFDFIIPVPLHKLRFTMRGYNQAELLSYQISKYTKIPMIKDVLIRIKFTKKQSLIPIEDRKSNIKDAFSIWSKEIIKGKNILLIDDIMTTGSTVNECSKELVVSGANEVTVFTFTHA